MKLFTKLFAAAALAVGLITAHAQDARKTAVLDTGKGGVKVVMSIPGWADGPFDFAKNPGVKKVANGPSVYSEAGFNAPVSDSGVVLYQAAAMSDPTDRSKTGAQKITAEHLANEMLKTKGFTTARAAKIDAPDTGIDGATVVAYKAAGNAIFDGTTKAEDKRAMVVMAVSLSDQKRGFAIMATVVEKDVAKFDADPAKYEKGAMKAFADVFKNSDWKVNP